MNDKLFKFICESYSEHYKKYLEYNNKFYEFKASGESLKAKESLNTREYQRQNGKHRRRDEWLFYNVTSWV